MSILNSSLKHQYFFEEISKIPHGSSNEQAISNYLVLIAKENNLNYYQDEIGNVVIYKKASKNYENHETVILQAHLDMVCESSGSGSFDFDNDPLNLYIEDGYLYAKGTTLGADDGVGIAYMLSILCDDSLQHPNLECVFTVQEETTMEGAFKLDASVLSGTRLINIDGEEEGVTNIASAGGIDIIMKKALMKVEAKYNMFELLVTGLSGGHSGAEIHKEKGNAIKILGRIFNYLRKEYEIEIANIEGGQKINAIPREATAIFTIDLELPALKEKLSAIEKVIKKEFEFSDKSLMLDVRQTKTKRSVVKIKDSNNIIDALMLLPTGVRSRSIELNGLTNASSNIGVCYFNDNIITLEASIRGASDSYVRSLEDEYKIIGNVLAFDVLSDNWYPSFDYLENSKLRNVMNEVYEKMYQKPLVMEAIHGGLECGIFKNKLKNIDIVTMGPNMEGVHTPDEKLELASFDRTYEFLCAFIAAL